MNDDIRHSNYVPPSLEMTQRYIEEARQLRNETIMRGIRHALAGLGQGTRWLGARLSGALRQVTAKGEHQPRAG